MIQFQFLVQFLKKENSSFENQSPVPVRLLERTGGYYTRNTDPNPPPRRVTRTTPVRTSHGCD